MRNMLIVFGMICGLSGTLLGADEPAGTKFEAEDHHGSDSKIVEDADASGGKAVFNEKAWQPLVVIDTPAEGGEVFTIHIRHKGGPLLLKGVVGGKQKEFKQVWDKPKEWKWTKVSKVKRPELGDKLFVIRGDGDEKIGIDAVIYEGADSTKAGEKTAKTQATDEPVLPDEVVKQSEEKVLPPETPRADAEAIQVDLSIDWNQSVGQIPAMIWGVNDYEIHKPASAGDEGYNAFLTKLNPPIIRIHRGSFPGEWLDPEQKHFDVEKIKAAVKAASGYGESAIMLNIAAWPAWMNDGDSNRLSPEHEDEWVAMCVELVKVMRDQVGRRVEYWEVTNERDGSYGKADKLDDLWRIYNKAVTAMRAEDPTAKFGGPAFTWANPVWVKPFVKNCLQNSDFVTYHNYGTGDIYAPNDKLFATLDSVEKNARYIRSAVDEAADGKHIPIHLSEYNVKWTWDPFERRHANSVGAVFHAGLIRRIALAGIDGAEQWHLKGNAYGLIDGDNQPRLTSYLYLWGAKELVGSIAKDTVSLPDTLEVLAVKRADGSKALLIANRADGPVILPGLDQLIGSTRVRLRQVNANQAGDIDTPTGNLALPGYSVTLITPKN